MGHYYSFITIGGWSVHGYSFNEISGNERQLIKCLKKNKFLHINKICFNFSYNKSKFTYFCNIINVWIVLIIS